MMEVIQPRYIFLKIFKDVGICTPSQMFIRLKNLYYAVCHVFVQICV